MNMYPEHTNADISFILLINELPSQVSVLEIHRSVENEITAAFVLDFNDSKLLTAVLCSL